MKTLSRITLILTATLSLASTSSRAATFQPHMSVGLEFGGERMAEFTYSDGKKRSFDSAGLAYLSGGVHIKHPLLGEKDDFATRISLGFKAASLSASNAELTFFRWLVEVGEFYRLSETDFQFGAGVSYHFANEITATGAAAALKTDVDPSLGVFLGTEYYLFEKADRFLSVQDALVGLRYTFQKYKSGNETVSANGVGVHFTLFWL